MDSNEKKAHMDKLGAEFSDESFFGTRAHREKEAAAAAAVTNTRLVSPSVWGYSRLVAKQSRVFDNFVSEIEEYLATKHSADSLEMESIQKQTEHLYRIKELAQADWLASRPPTTNHTPALCDLAGHQPFHLKDHISLEGSTDPSFSDSLSMPGSSRGLEHVELGADGAPVNRERKASPECDAIAAYTTACAQVDTPVISSVLQAQGLSVLTLDKYGLACPGAVALAQCVERLTALTELSLVGNVVQGPGVTALATAIEKNPSINKLVLDQNPIGATGADSLARLLEWSREGPQCSLRHLSLESCKVGDAGLVNLVKAVQQHTALTHLNLGGNGVGSQCASELEMLLEKNDTLLVLDLKWNHIRRVAAESVCAGLARNVTLHTLDLSWNGFGDIVPCQRLVTALQSGCRVKVLNLSNNRIGDKSACVLAAGLTASADLMELIVKGNPLGAVGCRSILRAFTREETLARTVRLDDCNIGLVDPLVFDPVNPAGVYALDMSDPYSQTVVRNLVTLAYHKKGKFAKGTTRLDGNVYNIPIRIDWEDASGPEKGILEFNFVSTRAPPQLEDVMSKQDVSMMTDLITRAKSSIETANVLDMIMNGDAFLLPSQVAEIFPVLKSSEDRVKFIKRCLHKVVGSSAREEITALLTEAEVQDMENSMSNSSLFFHPDNATGHYRLNLAESTDRETFFRLQEIRAKELLEHDRTGTDPSAVLCARPRSQFQPPTPLEFLFLNFRLDHQEFLPSEEWAVPSTGIVELDFVDYRKPPETAVPIETVWATPGEKESDVESQIYRMMQCDSEAERMKELRCLTHHYYFTAAQAKHILARFTSSSMREDCLVVLFRRIVDHHAFACDVLKELASSEFFEVRRRLGVHNIFDPICAVDFYSLHFVDNRDRYIMAELIRLAIVEPGDNMLSCLFDGLAFSVPGSWSKDIPRKGRISVYYCRSATVIEQVMDSVPAHTLPPNYRSVQPAGGEWVADMKQAKIKHKMECRFSDPRAAFEAMDTDGGGELSRQEFARGLRNLGVFLEPDETTFLFELLDEDGGGSIDFDELRNFWDNTKCFRMHFTHGA